MTIAILTSDPSADDLYAIAATWRTEARGYADTAARMAARGDTRGARAARRISRELTHDAQQAEVRASRLAARNRVDELRQMGIAP